MSSVDEIRLAVVGSRKYKDYHTVSTLLNQFREDYGDFTLICGMEMSGADGLGHRYATEHNLPIEEYKPDWDDVEVPGAVVKLNTYGRPYNAMAGMARNTEMAKTCTHVLAFWNGKSPGTLNMLRTCKKLGKKMKVFLINAS